MTTEALTAIGFEGSSGLELKGLISSDLNFNSKIAEKLRRLLSFYSKEVEGEYQLLSKRLVQKTVDSTAVGGVYLYQAGSESTIIIKLPQKLYDIKTEGSIDPDTRQAVLGIRRVIEALSFHFDGSHWSSAEEVVHIYSGAFRKGLKEKIASTRAIWEQLKDEMSLAAPHTLLMEKYYSKRIGTYKSAAFQKRYRGDLEKLITPVKEKRGKKNRLGLTRVLRFAMEIAGGLGTMHKRGFVHLDIRPRNIFFDDKGNLVIADLEYAGPRTKTTVNPHSYWYWPREAEAGGRYLDFTDIYGLAATLLHLSLGERRFFSLEPEIKGGLRHRWGRVFHVLILQRLIKKMQRIGFMPSDSNIVSFKKAAKKLLRGTHKQFFSMAYTFLEAAKRPMEGLDLSMVIEPIRKKIAAYEHFGKLIDRILYIETKLFLRLQKDKKQLPLTYDELPSFDYSDPEMGKLASETQDIAVFERECGEILKTL